MKRPWIGILLFVSLARPAVAHVCTCTTLCGIGSGTGWSGAASCKDADGPDQETDALVVGSGGNLRWDKPGTRVYDYLWVQPGGTATVTASPVVMQFDGPPLSLHSLEVFFAVGNSGDARGTFSSIGKDLTVSWTGAGAAVRMQLGPSPFGGAHDPGTNYTQVTMRGVERVATGVLNYSRGAAAPAPDTDMVDCLDGLVAPTGGAVGDTIVFTSGRSTDYWYEVTGYPDQCTGPRTPFANCTAAHATAECPATACGGGPCDLQIDRASTGSTPGSVALSRSWSSHVMVPGDGGPFRHPTPEDNDGDGTPNGDGTLPAAGDGFVVFKPVLIQGGANPITNGILTHFPGAKIDWRYVEISKGSGQGAENCAGGTGSTVLWDVTAQIGSPEGAMEFVNVHNFASRQGVWEVSQTDRTNDLRPNVPRTYRHFYIHDVDPQVGVTCPGEGQHTFGQPVNYFMDEADGVQDGITMENFHFARWGVSAALATIPSGAVARNIVWRNILAHSCPGIAGYGVDCAGLMFGNGNVLAEGVALWDLGAESRGGSGILGYYGASVSYVVRNAFIVNVDGNSLGASDNSAAAGGCLAGSKYDDTSSALLTNCYLSRIVGAASYGGRLQFNFIKDMNMEDDGAAPCDASDARGAIHAPVQAIGNVVTRSHPLSCTGHGVQIKFTVPSAFSNRTRRIESNYFSNMDAGAAAYSSCLNMQASVVPITRDIEFYNNICNLYGNTGTGPDFGIVGVGANDHRTTARYNIFYGIRGAGPAQAITDGIGTRVEGYNRFSLIDASPAVHGGNGPDDIDSDADYDLFVDRPDFFSGTPCWSPELDRNPWGGPVGALLFGIQSFDLFHPAVVPLMDADAFRNYHWHECGRTEPALRDSHTRER